MAYLTAPPEGSLVFRPSGLSLEHPEPKSLNRILRPKPSDVPRPFLG